MALRAGRQRPLPCPRLGSPALLCRHSVPRSGHARRGRPGRQAAPGRWRLPCPRLGPPLSVSVCGGGSGRCRRELRAAARLSAARPLWKAASGPQRQRRVTSQGGQGDRKPRLDGDVEATRGGAVHHLLPAHTGPPSQRRRKIVPQSVTVLRAAGAIPAPASAFLASVFTSDSYRVILN